ncbi:MAG: DUF1850 domain-containing protein [Clostridia bacterium]|nr:DUF1850 domain-containing protein [Clostridia bacterium]
MKEKYALLFLIILILFFLFLFPVNVLEVRIGETDELIYQQPAKVGDCFDIQWTHSVTLRPVIETYQLEAPGKISMVKMEFDEFGPNLPAHPEFNQYWIIADGKYTVMGYDLVFERVPVTIGAVVADHTLVYNGIKTPLKNVYRPGGYVQIGFTNKKMAKFLIEEVEIWQKNRKKQ